MILKPGYRWGAVTGKVSFTPEEALKELGFVMHPDSTGVIFRGYSYLDDNLQKRRGTFVSNYFPPSNPRTPAQKEQRKKLTNAVKEWHKLHPGAHDFWNKKARGMQMSGFNLYLSNRLKST